MPESRWVTAAASGVPGCSPSTRCSTPSAAHAAQSIAALDAGRLGHAVLDVFRTEPLPAAHPFWAHPGITVTPHIAAETRPATAARVVAENLRRAMDGRALLHLVDRARGY